MMDEQTRSDLEAFRSDTPSWADMPDHLIVDTFAFNAYQLRLRARELGWVVDKVFGFTRRLDRMEAFLASRRDSAIRRYFRS